LIDICQCLRVLDKWRQTTVLMSESLTQTIWSKTDSSRS